jgi:hypothetical protein
MSLYPGERCQHMKISGDRCGAPALRDHQFCRFHNCCRPATVDVSISAAVPPAPFLLPVLEDAPSIQLAITQVCEHLLEKRLDTKKAGVLLYAMQVASSNLGRLNDNKSQDTSQQKSSEENNRENSEDNSEEKSAEAYSPASASSEAISTGQDDSGSISSAEPDRLPPGTIQACEQRRRFVV